jgi:N-acylneuraminate cytidylyltransferase/CMP-N,N'-diacetyllegionaminic acid synthase
MLLAIIPARGGSKGIPRKNLALLRGRPLIEYSIEVAQQSSLVDEILLSTDDDEIAAVGRRMGLDVSYRRPVNLSADATPMIDTLEHALRWLDKTRGQVPDEVLLLQPTSPLRSTQDIEGAVALFRESRAPSVVSVHSMAEHPSECIVGTSNKWEYLVTPPEGAIRRQDYEQNFYFINGAIYLARAETLLARRGFIYPRETVMFAMPRSRGLDIDTQLDLSLAEAVLGLATPNAE